MDKRHPLGIFIIGSSFVILSLWKLFFLGMLTEGFQDVRPIVMLVGIFSVVMLLCGAGLLVLLELARKTTIWFSIFNPILLIFVFAQRLYPNSCQSVTDDCWKNYYKPFDLDTLISRLPILLPILLLYIIIIIYLRQSKIKECFK